MEYEEYLDENGMWMAYTESQIFNILSQIGVDIKNGDGGWSALSCILNEMWDSMREEEE
ncbi:hypothetical protein [Holdemanella porci]|uniref:hypothetical protein n=1 Tax=Holdemanella porci TaxID=2652276 RepID=UPI003AB2C259